MYEKAFGMGDVTTSDAFNKYVQKRVDPDTGKNFANMDEWQQSIIDRYNRAGRPLGNETESAEIAARKEMVADFVADELFGGRNFETLLNAVAPQYRNGFVKFISEIFAKLKEFFRNDSRLTEIERLEKDFIRAAKKAAKSSEPGQQKTTTDEGSGVKHSLPLSEIRKWDIAWDKDNHSSIKSQLIKHLDEVNVMAPVAEVDFVKEENKTYSQMLGEVLKKNFGNKIQTQLYGEIIFDEDAISTLGNYVNNDSEAAAAMAAPYIIKKGKAISGHKNHKGKGSVSVTFAAPVVINGNVANVAVCVVYGKGKVHSLRVLTPEGKTFELAKNEKEEATTAVRSLKTAGNPHITSSKYSLPEKTPKVKKIFGFDIRNGANVNEDLLEELSIYDPSAEVDIDGNITAYHRTSAGNANKIKKSGIMTAKEDALFFSSKDSGYASEYGDTVIKLKIPSTVLRVNDIFDGEIHFDIPLKYKNGGFSLDVSKYLVNTENIRYSLPDNPTALEIGDAYKNGEITPEQYKAEIARLNQGAVKTSGKIKQGEMVEPTNKPYDVPKSVSSKTKVRQYIRTVLETGYATPEMEAYLTELVLNGDFSYTPTTNKEQFDNSIIFNGYQCSQYSSAGYLPSAI